ncbi:MAG TPA: hypothetical protein VL424_14920 [Pararobbsia sp.]|jgi:hypothetical protein|nr:hypothetical protein [Pararobbsia sp.]
MQPHSSQFHSPDTSLDGVARKVDDMIRKAQIPVGFDGPRVTCEDLRRLVDLRLKEAHALADAGCPCGAYYLAGYAAELALKVRIAETVKRCEFPNAKLANASCRHNLRQLIDTAGLTTEFKRDLLTNDPLRSNWHKALQWSESSRYDDAISMPDASRLIDAIEAPVDGVLNWIKQYWSGLQ